MVNQTETKTDARGVCACAVVVYFIVFHDSLITIHSAQHSGSIELHIGEWHVFAAADVLAIIFLLAFDSHFRVAGWSTGALITCDEM